MFPHLVQLLTQRSVHFLPNIWTNFILFPLSNSSTNSRLSTLYPPLSLSPTQPPTFGVHFLGGDQNEGGDSDQIYEMVDLLIMEFSTIVIKYHTRLNFSYGWSNGSSSNDYGLFFFVSLLFLMDSLYFSDQDFISPLMGQTMGLWDPLTYHPTLLSMRSKMELI